MVRVNKNIAAALGYAVFGRAVFGLDLGSQNIPSELYDGAEDIGLVARPDAIVSKRAPFEIDQPGTPEQQIVWDIFSKACDCFSVQPETGGVEPPAIGPRGRDWWYAHDPGIPPIYFNYFMKETLTLYHQGITPLWCRLPVSGDSYINSAGPDVNYNYDPRLYVRIFHPYDYTILYRSFINVPGYFHKKIYLYPAVIYQSGMAQRSIAVREVILDTWDEETLTWNNQPELGELLAILDPPFTPPKWESVNIGLVFSIALTLADESPPPLNASFHVIFHARESPIVEWQPFLQKLF